MQWTDWRRGRQLPHPLPQNAKLGLRRYPTRNCRRSQSEETRQLGEPRPDAPPQRDERMPSYSAAGAAAQNPPVAPTSRDRSFRSAAIIGDEATFARPRSVRENDQPSIKRVENRSYLRSLSGAATCPSLFPRLPNSFGRTRDVAASPNQAGSPAFNPANRWPTCDRPIYQRISMCC